MAQEQHTPGPWEARGAMQHGEVLFWDIEPKSTGKYRGSVATVHQAEHIEGITADERDANAKLIAAAPDMLAALKAEAEADEAFDAADEYTHRADAEDWLNDPTGSLHVTEAWDRADRLRGEAKKLRAAAIAKAEPVVLQSRQPKKETV